MDRISISTCKSVAKGLSRLSTLGNRSLPQVKEVKNISFSFTQEGVLECEVSAHWPGNTSGYQSWVMWFGAACWNWDLISDKQLNLDGPHWPSRESEVCKRKLEQHSFSLAALFFHTASVIKPQLNSFAFRPSTGFVAIEVLWCH